MDVFEAMETCRAIRFLKPAPVPEELLRKLVHAATRASNPGNSQNWDFVVLRELSAKKRIGEAVQRAMGPVFAAGPQSDDPVQRRMLRGAAHLAQNLADVPALIFVCGRNAYPPGAPNEQFVWSALYPAAQNLIVAARALGLGSTFTTFHMTAEADVRDALAIPDDVRIGATIAVGYPDQPFGPLARKPLDEVLHWERW